MLASLLLLAQTTVPVMPPPREFSLETRTFGSIVSAAGDQDGDGIPDLVLGERIPEWKQRVRGEPELETWLISGRDGATLGWFRVHGAESTDPCAMPAGSPELDRLVCSAPIEGGEGCTLALVDGRSGCELWHTPAYRGFRGRLRAHLAPVSASPTTRATPLELALLCCFSCVPETLPYAWTSLKAETNFSCGVLVIDDLLGEHRREIELLRSAEPAVRGEPSKGVRYRREREQISRGPEEWGGGSGAVAVLGDLDGDGFDEIGEGVPDRVRLVSGRTGELVGAVGTDSKEDMQMGFGTSVANLGDVDGDDVDDFAVAETETLFSGSVRAFSGASRGPIWIACPPFDSAADQFGQELAPVGDVDGDGVTDLIVGTEGWYAGVPGYAALLSGKTGTALLEFRRGRSGVVAGRPDPALSWMPVR